MHRLHIISSGCPDPRKERFGSSILLDTGDPDDLLMVDCGPGTTYKMACMGIAPTRVNQLFLTHHHFDHNADVPCFGLTRWDQSSTDPKPLQIVGPAGTAAFVDRLFGEHGAYQPDIIARIEHPASRYLHEKRGGTLPRPAPQFPVHEIKQGPLAFSHPRWQAEVVPVHHCGPQLDSVAFTFTTGEGTIVFTGDAGPCDAVDALARQADVLVVCCAYYQRVHMHPDVATCVTGSEDCARLAAMSPAHTIVLTHTTAGVDPAHRRAEVVATIQAQTTARVIFADEQTSIELSQGVAHPAAR